MSLLRQALKQMMTCCVSSRWLLTRGPGCAPNTRPRLALTFDDGPHPRETERVLNVLKSGNLKATFFVVGGSAAGHPDLIRRMADEGHEVGNHTWYHHEPALTSSRQFLDEVRQTDSYLKNLTGSLPQSMRPPKGELNWTKLTGLWKQGKTIALWNVDPRDFRMSRPEEITRWAAAYEPHDGDVLLFHDNHPWAAIAVERMLDRGIFDFFQSVTISQMVGRMAALGEEHRSSAESAITCPPTVSPVKACP